MESKKACCSPPGSWQLKGVREAELSPKLMLQPLTTQEGGTRWCATDITAVHARRCNHLEIIS